MASISLHFIALYFVDRCLAFSDLSAWHFKFDSYFWQPLPFFCYKVSIIKKKAKQQQQQCKKIWLQVIVVVVVVVMNTRLITKRSA